MASGVQQPCKVVKRKMPKRLAAAANISRRRRLPAYKTGNTCTVSSQHHRAQGRPEFTLIKTESSGASQLSRNFHSELGAPGFN